jgi:hypothetical protein
MKHSTICIALIVCSIIFVSNVNTLDFSEIGKKTQNLLRELLTPEQFNIVESRLKKLLGIPANLNIDNSIYDNMMHDQNFLEQFDQILTQELGKDKYNAFLTRHYEMLYGEPYNNSDDNAGNYEKKRDAVGDDEDDDEDFHTNYHHSSEHGDSHQPHHHTKEPKSSKRHHHHTTISTN